MRIEYSRPYEGMIFNYVAINPKTKQGIVVPYEAVTDDGVPPKIKINAGSNKICTYEERTTFQSIGTVEYLRPTNTRYLCLHLLSNKTWDYEFPLRR